jgi:hypothetical protein
MQTHGSGSMGGSAATTATDVEAAPAGHWRVAWRFAVHTCVGSLIFGTISLSALLLNWSVEWIDEVHRTDLVIILVRLKVR